jgi:hypothetical protein
MSNNYFDWPAKPAQDRFVRFDTVRAADNNEAFDLVSAGFDLLPDPDALARGSQMYATSTTGNDSYVIAVSPNVNSYDDGDTYLVGVDVGNTGAASLNVNGLGSKVIVRYDGSAIETGDISAGQIIQVSYSAAQGKFQLSSSSATANAAAAAASAVAAAASASAAGVSAAAAAASAAAAAASASAAGTSATSASNSAIAAAASAAAAAALVAALDPDTSAAAADPYADADRFPMKQGGVWKRGTMSVLASYILRTATAYLLASASAVARSIFDKMRETVSAEDFGADPTGVADSTAAVQAALNNTEGPGGAPLPVRMKEGGSYTLGSGGVLIPVGGGLLCSGQFEFYCPAAAFPNVANQTYDSTSVAVRAVGLLVAPYTQHDGVRIRGMKVRYEVADARYLAGVSLRNVKNFFLDDVEVMGMPIGRGIQIDSSNNGKIRHAYIHDCTTNHAAYGYTPQMTGLETDQSRVPANGVGIASITFVGTTATMTTTEPHNRCTGETITVTGAAPAQYNVVAAAITVTGPKTLTYTMGGVPATNATIVGSYICTAAGSYDISVEYLRAKHLTFGAAAIAAYGEQTDGYHTLFCSHNIQFIEPDVEDVSEGWDNQGRDVITIGGIFKDCRDWASKHIHGANNCSQIGSRIVRPGRAGIVVSTSNGNGDVHDLLFSDITIEQVDPNGSFSDTAAIKTIDNGSFDMFNITCRGIKVRSPANMDYLVDADIGTGMVFEVDSPDGYAVAPYSFASVVEATFRTPNSEDVRLDANGTTAHSVYRNYGITAIGDQVGRTVVFGAGGAVGQQAYREFVRATGDWSAGASRSSKYVREVTQASTVYEVLEQDYIKMLLTGASGQRLVVQDTAAGADEKIWQQALASGDLTRGTRTDLDGAGATFETVSRTGTVVDMINWNATTMRFGGISSALRRFDIDASGAVTQSYSNNSLTLVNDVQNPGITASGQGVYRRVQFGAGGVVGAVAFQEEVQASEDWSAGAARSSVVVVKGIKDGATGEIYRFDLDSMRLSVPLTVTANSASAALQITQAGAGNAVTVEDVASDTTPFIIDASGLTALGHTAAIAGQQGNAKLGIDGSGGGMAMALQRNTNDAGGVIMELVKSRGTAPNAVTIVQSGDAIGSLMYTASDGVVYRQAAIIRAEVDGTPGSGDMPARLLFLVTLDGAAAPSEAMRIANTKVVSMQAQLDLSAAAAGPIAFPASQNASAGANVFDDYEEGTWTPVLTFVTPGNLNVVYSVQVGTYTKVGREVHLHVHLTLSTFTHTTASGNLNITGSPFTAANNNLVNTGVLAWTGITKANYTAMALAMTPNSAVGIVRASGSGQVLATLTTADMPTGGTPQLHGQMTFHV